MVLSCILDINTNFVISFSDISGQRKLQRDRAHLTIRTKGAKCGQSTSGQRGSRGENHSRIKGRGRQTEVFIIGKGKKFANILLINLRK